MQTEGQDKQLLGASREQAKRLSGDLREHFVRAADRRIEAIAKEFEHIGEDLGQHEHGNDQPVSAFITQFAGRAAELIRGKKSTELFEYGRSEIGKRPGLFLAGLVGVGFFGARMLRR